MIDLAVWNLSIPVGSPPKTIETPRLKAGFEGKYFNSDGGKLYFWTPVTGSTTDNAKYPRTELRETDKTGALRNWKYGDADSSLTANLEVTQVPSSGKIVIGQIHAYESTKPMLKLEYQYSDDRKTGKIVAKLRRTPTVSKSKVILIANNVPLNTRFNYKIHISPKGALGISARGESWTSKVSSKWKDKLLYFKAGVYAQDHTGYTSEGGQVTFYKLKIKHES